MAHKLLLADDSVTVQRVIELTFRDEGMEVVAVGDGRQAIERLRDEKPDVVLADVSMPERNGYEVAEYVKQTPDLQHIPVVLMTGAFEPLDEGRARAAGCDGVLAKPFEPHMAISLVRQLLGNPASRSSTLGPVGSSLPVSGVAAGYPFEPDGARTGVGSLDEYFNRLDEALSGVVAERRADAGDGVRTEPGDPDAESSRGDLPRAGTVSGEGQAPGSLADAFSLLLADELGEAAPVAPVLSHPRSGPTPVPPAAPLVDEELIEAVTRRVIERISDKVVRQVVETEVLDLAARLVREEIERLKAQA